MTVQEAGPVRYADRLAGLTVADVVVTRPKTLPAHATVAEAQLALADDHVHLLLLTEGRRLLGTLVRDDLPVPALGPEPALPLARLGGRTLPAGTPADEALALLAAAGQRRRAVVDDAGHLVGLLCLKRRGTGFCSDADVAARGADLPGG